jgi:hypothetical protein
MGVTTKFPRVGGVAPDFSSITIYIRGKPFIGVTAIDYSATREPGKLKGTSPRVLARTRGEITFSGSMTLNREDAAELRKQLGPGYMEVDFDITVTYKYKGGTLTEDKITGACITEDSDSNSSGTDPLQTEFTLDILEITKSGVSPIAAD